MLATDRKSRMISFRVSGDELEMLKDLHRRTGARNLSEYARFAMLQGAGVGVPSSPRPYSNGAEALAVAVRDLALQVDQMQRDLRRFMTEAPAAPVRPLSVLDLGMQKSMEAASGH